MPENNSATAVGVVPARLGSTRLPEKMLALIKGRPLIVWTAEAAINSGAFSRVIVATDHDRIFQAVTAAGFEAMMTDSALPSGSARVAAVARQIEAPVFVNIQGDEPLVDGAGLRRIVAAFQDPQVDMATLSFPLSPADEQNSNAVKVVIDRRGDAMYFSRSLIPFPRSREGFAPLKHLGVYGYRRETLLRLMTLEPCPLEKIESLEQLRALFHGIRIRVLPAEGDSIGVDVAADLERVRAAVEGRSL
jgi:3-deoxy-manno-octulosonate cytidylyltransferase (CMP-KDO synthetase)